MENGMKKPRKKRCDRNHLIYLLTSPSGKRYIGVTYARGRAYRASLRQRWLTHCRNANVYNYDTDISVCIREEGADKFELQILKIIRGKDEAHALERKMIADLQPELNMEGMGRKRKS